MFISHLSGSRYRDLRMRIQVSRDRNSAYGLLSNLAGSLRERRVSLKHMAYHSHGKLRARPETLFRPFCPREARPPLPRCACAALSLSRGLTMREISTMRRASAASGRRDHQHARFVNMRLNEDRRVLRHCRTPPARRFYAISRRFPDRPRLPQRIRRWRSALHRCAVTRP